MFDEKLMEKIAAKLDASLVILPSSVDEVIIMRETEGMLKVLLPPMSDRVALCAMIREKWIR